MPLALDCSAATLKQSLLGKNLRISTHCSGIGAAEVAAEMLVVNSARELGFSVKIMCTSACDTTPVCRRVLLRQSSERHVFSNIFDFFPDWDQELHEPEAVINVLKEFCAVHEERTALWHDPTRRYVTPIELGAVMGFPTFQAGAENARVPLDVCRDMYGMGELGNTMHVSSVGVILGIALACAEPI
eukprot:s2833_g6.t1